MSNADWPAAPLNNTMSERFAQGYADPVGLTKREIFAMHAMAGMCANSDLSAREQDSIASVAVRRADALLEALELPK